MNPFFIVLPGWAVCAFVAYGMRERAVGQLPAEKIGELVLAQRSDRIALSIRSGVILLVFIVLRFIFLKRESLCFLLFLAAIAMVSVYSEVKSQKSVIALIPSAPARTLVIAGVIGLLGWLCILGAMAATVL